MLGIVKHPVTGVWFGLYYSELGLLTLDLGIPGLPSLSSPLPHSLTLGGPCPLNQLEGLVERYKLSQWGLGQSHSRETIWYVSEQKGATLLATMFVYFYKNKF